jgi:SNF2 family DNA or RNA helicase
VANDSPPDKLAILLANIEATRTEAFMDALDTFLFRKFLLVVDESTVVKNHKAQQSKSTLRIAKNAAYTRILTGTPITQSPLDLWSQCRVLDELALPYPSFTSFKHEFAIEQTVYLGPNRPQFQKIVGYRNQEKLAKLLEGFSTRILKKDCLDLPEKIYQCRYVELTAEQKRVYKDLVKQCLAIIEPGMVTVTSALTAMLRLHQVTLGYVKSDDGQMRPIESNRIGVLEELLEENPTKTIIFCRFLEDVRQISALVKRPFVTYTGEMGPDVRSAAIESFQNDPGCGYFIATDAAARGLTLTAAEHVIYYSQGFSLETRLQSEDRAHRIGQKKHVLYTDLIAEGTIDEKIIDALHQKQELAQMIVDRKQLEQILSLTS